MKSDDYARVEQAIRFLDENTDEPPALDEVAAHMGLSGPHFQRLFKRWAGVSPKQFVQYLTLEHARSLLRESRSVLDVTNELGLSSQGRLHDLFVSIDAVTPGEFKSLGRGLEIRYGFHDSPFGSCLLAETDRGICRLSFVEDRDEELAGLQSEWSKAVIRADPQGTREAADAAFESFLGTDAPVRLFLKGTNFQLQVWQALLRIPLGSAVSYQDIASRMNVPNASRAIGQAVGANPVAVLIPCHRVLRQLGGFSGYRWGVPRKKALLAWESARHSAMAEASEA